MALVLGLAIFTPRAGSFLHDEDALAKADAICVLSGTRMERQLEAADLYLQGYAPTVVLTEDAPDGGVVALRERGVVLPSTAQAAREILVTLGVDPRAILIIPEIHDSTAAEAHSFGRLAAQHRWDRLIVVTSKFHTRRAGFAVRRELRGTGVDVLMRASRYDPADPERWWRTRGDIRWTLSEGQKLILYGLGLGK